MEQQPNAQSVRISLVCKEKRLVAVNVTLEPFPHLMLLTVSCVPCPVSLVQAKVPAIALLVRTMLIYSKLVLVIVYVTKTSFPILQSLNVPCAVRFVHPAAVRFTV